MDFSWPPPLKETLIWAYQLMPSLIRDQDFISYNSKTGIVLFKKVD